MMRRIAVVGDKLEKGGAILSYVGPVFTIGDEGYQVALVGGWAYCEACKSTGAIAKAGGPRRIKFMGETAADDDIVLCQCASPSRIVASLSGDSWCDDMVEELGMVTTGDVDARSSAAMSFDEQFLIRDTNGNSLSGMHYTIKVPSGVLWHGITDSEGRTARYQTNGARNIAIHLGHKKEA